MPELSSVFSLVNYAFVLFFGIVAALYFAVDVMCAMFKNLNINQ